MCDAGAAPRVRRHKPTTTTTIETTTRPAMDETDEEVARRLQREEDDAARALGRTREAIRQEQADAEYARQLDAEERRRAFGDGDGDGDGDERVGDGATRRRPVSSAPAPGRLGRELGGAFAPLLSEAMRRLERVATEGLREVNRASASASASASARASARGGIEFTIGRNGETTTLDLNDAFEGINQLMDSFVSEGGRTTILDLLNFLRQSGFSTSAPEQGVSEDARRAMTVRPYARAQGETENACCSVCLSQLENGEEAKYLPCKHVYHPECIDRWLERSKLCPVCKRDVTASTSCGSH